MVPFPRVLTGMRRLVTAALCTVAIPHAQPFPDPGEPPGIIAPAGAAIVTDLLARAYAKAVADPPRLNAIVESKPDAELVIGVQAFAASPADGDTILFSTRPSQMLNPRMRPSVPTLRDESAPDDGLAGDGLAAMDTREIENRGRPEREQGIAPAWQDSPPTPIPPIP